MTPTVQFQIANVKARAFSLTMIYSVVALLVLIFTGFWPVLLFGMSLIFFELASTSQRVAYLYQLESGLILEVRKVGYDKARTAVAQFEQEAEDEPNRFEQFRKKRFADLVRNILTDIHKQMEQNELGQN